MRFFKSLFTATLCAASLGIAQQAVCQAPCPCTTFDSSDGGWQVLDLTYRAVGASVPIIADYTPNYSANGGNGGGHIWIDDPTNNVFYWSAPNVFLGNQASSYGSSLWFDLKAEMGSYIFNQEDVVLVGGGRTLVFDSPVVPNGNWRTYAVPLSESGWRVGSLSGAVATRSDMETVLANLTALYIRGEFRGTEDDIGRLDNVKMFRLADGPFSGFDTDREDWGVVDLTYRAVGSSVPTLGSYIPEYSASGGNPDGHIWIDDPTNNVFYWSAPDEFLDDRSPSYGASLWFDLKAEMGSYVFNQEDVVLVGGGRTLVYDTAVVPNGDWQTYVVPLTESGWRVGSLSGAAATQADMQTVLDNLTALYIRGEFRGTEDDIGRLDNVILFELAPCDPLDPSSVDLLGDYNDDGQVDTADYVVWRKHVGTTTPLPNDLFGGVIGDDQYITWRENFGAAAIARSSSAATLAVPEPTGFASLIFGLAALVVGFRRAN